MKRILIGALCLPLVACSNPPSVTDNVGQAFTIVPDSVIVGEELDPNGDKLKAATDELVAAEKRLSECSSGILSKNTCDGIYGDNVKEAKADLELWKWLSGEKAKVRKVVFRYVLTNLNGHKTPSDPIESICLAEGLEVPQQVKKAFNEYKRLPSRWGTGEIERLQGMACERYADFPSAK